MRKSILFYFPYIRSCSELFRPFLFYPSVLLSIACWWSYNLLLKYLLLCYGSSDLQLAIALQQQEFEQQPQPQPQNLQQPSVSGGSSRLITGPQVEFLGSTKLWWPSWCLILLWMIIVSLNLVNGTYSCSISRTYAVGKYFFGGAGGLGNYLLFCAYLSIVWYHIRNGERIIVITHAFSFSCESLPWD